MGFNDLELSERLLIARRGTAYLSQRLAELTDDELAGPPLLDGWTRQHLRAHIGYNAAALCRLMDWAATGVETPMYASTEQRAQEIAEGATLSPAALRNLFAHTVARLDEKWRHLPESAWQAQVRTAQGRLVPAEETVWMRTREVWIHAVDLDNGGRFGDFPKVVLESLLDDIVGMAYLKDVTKRVFDNHAAEKNNHPKLLTEVEQAPKNSEAFGTKVTDAELSPTARDALATAFRDWSRD